MSNTPPVITGVTPTGPVTAQAGTAVQLTVVSQDADARTETLELTPVNIGDGTRGASVLVPITWSDDVKIEARIKETGSPTVVTVAGNKVTLAG